MESVDIKGMFRKYFLLVLILGISSLFSQDSKGTEEAKRTTGVSAEHDEEGHGGGSGAGSGAAEAFETHEYGHLSLKKWEEYSTEKFLKEEDGGKFMASLPGVLKECAKIDGQRMKDYYDTHLDSTGDTTNFSTVRVFYRNADGRYHKEFPHAFLSSMSVGELPTFPGLESKVCLGNYYADGDRGVWRKPPYASSLLDDFLVKGFTKEDISQKRAHKLPDFNAQHFAHSEQAFMSYIMRGAEGTVSEDKKPNGVVIMISSTRDTCPNCNKLLKNFLNGVAGAGKRFKTTIFKKMFPLLSDPEAENLPTTIIYVYYLSKRTYGVSTKDLLDEVDFNAKIPYIKVSGNRD